jgi:hypothetical protein
LRPNVRQDGRFEIADVVPGAYYLLGFRFDDESNRSATVLPVNVDEADLDNVEIVMGAGYPVRGLLSIGNYRSNVRLPKSNGLRVMLRPVDEKQRLVVRGAPVIPNGRFNLWELPAGEYRLWVDGIPGGYYIKSARMGQVNPLEEPITLKGAIAPFLEIVLGQDSGGIQGLARAADDTALTSSFVLLVPERPSIETADRYRVTTVDQTGGFEMQGIAPGRYRLLLLDEFLPQDLYDPALKNYFKNGADIVEITAGQVAIVDLRKR